jgi:hypothetical protein
MKGVKIRISLWYYTTLHITLVGCVVQALLWFCATVGATPPYVVGNFWRYYETEAQVSPIMNECLGKVKDRERLKTSRILAQAEEEGWAG